MTRVLVVAFFVPLVFPLAASQPVRFQHLTVDEGLSQDLITCITQDDPGFMWFGAEDGLNRYDGYSIRVYKHNDRDSMSLAAKGVACLMADHRGHVWVGSALGAQMIDVRTQTLRQLTISPSGSLLAANCFCQDADSAVWVGTDAGLFRYANGGFTQAFLNNRRFTDRVWSMLQDKELLWIVDTIGLRCPSFDRSLC